MFDSLKKSLGLSKSKQESKGYRLGGRADPSIPESNETSLGYELFERHFNAEKLGMSICESNDPLIIDMDDFGNPCTVSRVIVTDVVANSEGARLGVQPGDVIFSLNGFELQQFEDFHNIIGALERPILMKFFRYKYNSSSPKAASTTAAKSATVSSSSGSGATKPTTSASSAVASIFKMGGKQTSPEQQLSESELAERRAMRAKAVADRSSTIWDKPKTGKGGINRSSSGTAGSGGSPRGESGGYNPGPIVAEEIPPTTNAETLRVIQKTKELEQNVEKSLGYSPFKPYMSFVGGSNSSQPIGESAAAGGLPPALQQKQEQFEEDEYMVAEVDDAFAMLLSLNDTEQEKAKVAIQTVQKMLQNLHANRDDVKFRSIRVSNKAFQAKVAATPGGVELLIAAGYRLELTRSYSSSDLLSSQSDSGRWHQEGGNGGGVAEGKDGYLLHDMTPKDGLKLAYTMARIEELMEMQGSR